MDSAGHFAQQHQPCSQARVHKPARLALLIILVFAALLLPGLTQAADNTLVDMLRKGGYVIYFRHAHTEWSQDDRVASPEDWKSCDPDQMRQLSDHGRAIAQDVGKQIRRLEIPVGEVIASEYCRCIDTAKLLGLGPVRTSRDIINARVADYVGGREVLKQTAQHRLSAPPPPGSNTVLVAHGNVFLLVAGTRPVEAGAAVVKPDQNGGFSVLGFISPEDWKTF